MRRPAADLLGGRRGRQSRAGERDRLPQQGAGPRIAQSQHGGQRGAAVPGRLLAALPHQPGDPVQRLVQVALDVQLAGHPAAGEPQLTGVPQQPAQRPAVADHQDRAVGRAGLGAVPGAEAQRERTAERAAPRAMARRHAGRRLSRHSGLGGYTPRRRGAARTKRRRRPPHGWRTPSASVYDGEPLLSRRRPSPPRRPARPAPGRRPQRRSPGGGLVELLARVSPCAPSETTSRLRNIASVQSAKHPDLAVQGRHRQAVVAAVQYQARRPLSLIYLPNDHRDALVQAEAGDRAHVGLCLYSCCGKPRIPEITLSPSTLAWRSACWAFGGHQAPSPDGEVGDLGVVAGGPDVVGAPAPGGSAWCRRGRAGRAAGRSGPAPGWA